MTMAQAAAMTYLRVIREARGMSQEEVARAAGVKSKQISRWETCESEPTAGALAGFVLAVRASAEQVMQLFVDPGATPDDARRLAQDWLSENARREIDRRAAELSDHEREVALRVLSQLLQPD